MIFAYLLYSMAFGVLLSLSTLSLCLEIFCIDEGYLIERDGRQIAMHEYEVLWMQTLIFAKHTSVVEDINYGHYSLESELKEILLRFNEKDFKKKIYPFQKNKMKEVFNEEIGHGGSYGGTNDAGDAGDKEECDKEECDRAEMTNECQGEAFKWIETSNKQMQQAVLTIRNSIVSTIYSKDTSTTNLSDFNDQTSHTNFEFSKRINISDGLIYRKSKTSDDQLKHDVTQDSKDALILFKIKQTLLDCYNSRQVRLQSYTKKFKEDFSKLNKLCDDNSASEYILRVLSKSIWLSFIAQTATKNTEAFEEIPLVTRNPCRPSKLGGHKNSLPKLV